MSEYQRKARLSCLCYRALQGYGGNFPHTLYLGVIWSSWSAKRRVSLQVSLLTGCGWEDVWLTWTIAWCNSRRLLRWREELEITWQT